MMKHRKKKYLRRQAILRRSCHMHPQDGKYILNENRNKAISYIFNDPIDVNFQQ